MTRLVGALLGLGLLAASVPTAARAESTPQQVAYGVGSVVGTLVYAPLKTGFCIVGAVTGGLTLPFGGPRTAEQVATAGCAGTWAITPDVLKGREPIRFVGGSAGPRTSSDRSP